MLTESDHFKIRRLILVKLFQTWHSEARSSRLRAAKAAQILSRMIRRSRGPLWIKESQLVCFHMWRRYSAVRRAYKTDSPDPVFGYPYLSQWNSLIKSIAIDRVYKKKVALLGQVLTMQLWFSRWKMVQVHSKDQDFLTDEILASRHYEKKLSVRVLHAWFGVVRMKGRAMRRRNRMFLAWKSWAPYKRSLSIKKQRLVTWKDLRRQRYSFNEMVRLCQQSIYRRVDTLRRLRVCQQDRRVLVCAYGFLGKSEHVIFLDCWRRWKMHKLCANRWRNTLLTFRHIWYATRNRGMLA